MTAPLAFSDALASPAYAEALARDGFVQINDVLTPDTAATLAATLKTGTPWLRSISVDRQGSDLPVEQVDGAPRDQQEQLLKIIWSEARDGFQYMFDRYRFWELAREGKPVLPMFTAVDALLNGPNSVELYRGFTGDSEINFVDAQACRYLPGHFLTMHDDRHGGRDRRYAYVLNLSERWRGDWGGLLLFHENDRISGGLMPLYNSLNVFRVPRMHSVSQVAAYAGAERLSITGWMRAGEP